jgi:hypothetical protein
VRNDQPTDVNDILDGIVVDQRHTRAVFADQRRHVRIFLAVSFDQAQAGVTPDDLAHPRSKRTAEACDQDGRSPNIEMDWLKHGRRRAADPRIAPI